MSKVQSGNRKQALVRHSRHRRITNFVELMLPIFTILHPLVDACSVSVLVVGGMTWERVIAYNAMAFALQLPIGMLMDDRIAALLLGHDRGIYGIMPTTLGKL